MKKFFALSLVGTVALASCNQASVSGSTKTYAFAVPTAAVTGYGSQAGTANRTDLSTKDNTVTVLSATKLKASTAYIAHYHLQGDATKAPCDSAGAVTDGMIGGMSFTSDANGSVTIKGLNTTANIANATYINIHEAATPSVIPLCADLTKK
jgi:superoxide dismutase, Cu-Zn family